MDNPELNKISVLTVGNIYEKYPEKMKNELEDFETLPSHILYGWLTFLSSTLTKEAEKDENLVDFAKEISLKIVAQRTNSYNLDVQMSQVVKILHQISQFFDVKFDENQIMLLKSLGKGILYKTNFINTF